jgi:hypothetical protein
MQPRTRLRVGLAACLASATIGASAGPLDDAIAGSKPILDVRLRFESVTQPTTITRTEEDADALTARLRVGFETGKYRDTALLVEGEFVGAWRDDYNSTANGKSAYPIVADPKVSELNRFQLVNTSIENTVITLGRQRILLEDQRFVGNVGWRQNEQTFDAVRIVNKPTTKLTLDLSYVNEVRRVFGADSLTQLPTFDGDIVLANAGYQIGKGKLTGFAYLLDLDNNPGASSATFGARYSGQHDAGKVKLSYAASYATQSDHGDNPASYDADYLLAEIGAARAGYGVTGGFERLGSDGTRGFATPLATLHKFQGWADVFLATPVNGIDDRYLGLGYTGKAGAFSALGVNLVYHDYQAARGDAGLGEEIDLQVSGKIGRVTGLLKYADYQGPAAAQDLRKWWAEISVAW